MPRSQRQNGKVDKGYAISKKIPQDKAKFQEIKLVVTDSIDDTDDNSFFTPTKLSC